MTAHQRAICTNTANQDAPTTIVRAYLTQIIPVKINALLRVIPTLTVMRPVLIEEGEINFKNIGMDINIMTISKYLKNSFRMKNVDHINKEYFTKTHPGPWFGLGMILCLIWAKGTFENIKDYIGVIIFIAYLAGALWCAYYGFFVIGSYREAPENSPARLAWLEEKKKRIDNPPLIDRFCSSFAKLAGGLIIRLGTIFVYVLLIGLGIYVLLAGVDLLASLSDHSLLIIVIILLLVK